MSNHELSQLIKHWAYISPHIHYPKNLKEYDQLVNKLDKLLEIVQDDESHQLMGLIDIISHIIEEYESKKIKHKMPTGLDALKYLMDAH